MNQSTNPWPVVSALLQKIENGERKIFIQTRWKPDVSPTYSGMVEIPAGGIDGYEDVYDALRREVEEECGLKITRIIGDFHGEVVAPRVGDEAFVFQPFVCQQVLSTNGGLPWLGFVFLCEVEGEVKMNNAEAKDPRWVTLNELRDLVENTPEKVFPLQLPVLNYYIQKFL